MNAQVTVRAILTGLTPGVLTSFRVRASTVGAETAWSPTVSIVVP